MNNSVLLFISDYNFYLSHFQDRFKAISLSGFRVIVLTNVDNEFSINNIKFLPIKVNRSSLNIFTELKTIVDIISIYKRIKPSVFHHVALKPIVYGGIALFFLGLKYNFKIINSPVGMGYVYSTRSLKNFFLKFLLLFFLKITLNPRSSIVIVENSDDINFFINKKLIKSHSSILIEGAGVDIHKYVPKASRNNIPVVTLVSRMLKDKGVIEFIEAAKIINKEHIVAHFCLVGDIDIFNPSSLSINFLNDIIQSPGIFWLGYRSDINFIYECSDIACLPSYREGLPKSLIEACACGLPIVTTDAIGCRSVVINGVNGLLVPVKSSFHLAVALTKMINDVHLRDRMGMASRDFAISRFSNEIIIKKTLEVYSQMMTINHVDF